MTRLRRETRSNCDFAVAAEVLELRSLLSAGAAAAHHALQVADHAAAPTPNTHPTLPTIPVTVQLNSPELFRQIPGTLTITPVVLKPGGHVTIHVSAEDDTVTPVFYTVAIKGKITSWHDVGISTQVSLVPTGKLTAKDGSGHTLGTLKPQTGTPLSLTLHQSTLAYITLDLNFISHSKPPILTDFQAEAA